MRRGQRVQQPQRNYVRLTQPPSHNRMNVGLHTHPCLVNMAEKSDRICAAYRPQDRGKL